MSSEGNVSLGLLQKQVETMRQQLTLKSGDGGGTSDGMEARVVKLEAGVEALHRDVTDLRADMKDVRDRLAKLEVKVDHLPSKGFVFGAYGIVSALLAAIMLFQTQIQQLLGVASGG